MKKVVLLLSVLFACLNLQAQYRAYEQDWGAWYMIFSRTQLSDRISYHAEAQHRLHRVFDRKQQLLLRTAVNYHLHDKVMVSTGFGRITSWFYPKEDAPDTLATRLLENRIYQQLVLRDRIGRFYFQHRFRMEPRWLNFGGRRSHAHRARYFLNIDVPLNRREMIDKTVFYSFYNEIFINIDPDDPFGQNRFFHALGYKFNKVVNVRIGYNYNFTGVNYNRLQFGVWITPDLRKND